MLDDLDVRASDLLQANVLIWLEGPSDRLYFNRWIELWSGGRLQEHLHYQCVWYGGALLANVTFQMTDPSQDFLAALRLNRNAIVLMDSDRRTEGDPLKPRVERICKEVSGTGGFAWVTAGREIENYIPVEALREALGKESFPAPGKYADVFEEMHTSRDRKLEFARMLIPKITREMLQRTHDLDEKLENVCQQIWAWNGQSVPGCKGQAGFLKDAT